MKQTQAQTFGKNWQVQKLQVIYQTVYFLILEHVPVSRNIPFDILLVVSALANSCQKFVPEFASSLSNPRTINSLPDAKLLNVSLLNFTRFI